MINVVFMYSIGDRVKIKELNVTGYVIALFYGEFGKQYFVAYFNKGEHKKEYLMEFEIDSDGGEKLTGFSLKSEKEDK
ncbi:MAG: hypothetical protein UT69_C0024G0010 [Candidatus Yanofskybacteria bacterium GW2011_GWE1_40_10]|nr:MAG: hypothetical protein UT69_C0024G0010 [Candidatus Yanofskybacteria bacterium GW2011_GWE1_40_10]